MTTTATLPAWVDLSDVDKGAVLLHLRKREWEGAQYAIEEYPARFFDHPALTGLEPREACAFAVSMRSFTRPLSNEERARLYDLALDEPDRRCLWGARDGDRVATITYYEPDRQPQGAQELVAAWAERGERGGVVVHRSEPAGEWHEAGGCDGCAEVTQGATVPTVSVGENDATT